MTREDYGIDAPTVVRNLALIGLALVVASAGAMLATHYDLASASPILRAVRNFLPSGIICLIMAFWMIASSKWLKHKVARTLLDGRQWRANEKVLDVGCGRGLVAVNAAKRVPDGHVTGIDIWQERDLAGNNPEAIRANADAAGVASLLTAVTGDARSLPCPDGTFDVVTSMTAIHNISELAGRTAAIQGGVARD